MAVLDINTVDPEWLIERAKNEGVDTFDSVVPPVWKKFIKKGLKERLLAWSTSIRTKEQQLPEPSGPGYLLLKELEEVDPYDFEKIIV